jgi:hypothetical protein
MSVAVPDWKRREHTDAIIVRGGRGIKALYSNEKRKARVRERKKATGKEGEGKEQDKEKDGGT